MSPRGVAAAVARRSVAGCRGARRAGAVCLVATLLLVACSGRGTPPPLASSEGSSGESPAPLLSASPTVVTARAPTPSETPRFLPLTEATQALVLEPPELVPTSSPTPPRVGLPPERLSILEPGPNSQVTSPFRVQGRGGPSWGSLVYLRLLGEDGSVLAERATYLVGAPGRPGRFGIQIPFAVEAVGENGRLEVSTLDPWNGQLDHLTTVSIVLLSVGTPLVHPALEGPEQLAILEPEEDGHVAGGVVHVRGAGWVKSDFTLSVAVRDYYGDTVGSATAELAAPGVDLLGTFEVDIPYSVTAPQYGSIVVYESSPDGAGMIHFTSQDVYLQP